jgi:hypothetical protein
MNTLPTTTDFATAFQILLCAALVGYLLYNLIRMVRKHAPEISARAQQEQNRRKISDVKPGDLVTIEWYDRIKGGVGQLKCLNNDPAKRVILLEIHWGNYKQAGGLKYEKLVLNYNDPHLENFHLLNTPRKVKPKTLEEKLKGEMDELLKQEKYEEASVIRDALNDLKIKSKTNLKNQEQ